MPSKPAKRVDALVIGSGFGGSMAAMALVAAGQRVVMLERGDWVPRNGAKRDPVRDFFQLTPAWTTETAYRIQRGRDWVDEGICACVGGPSVFYGGASFRLRTEDFDPGAEIVTESLAEWPFDYATLEPWYSRAEALLGVTGEAGVDPTEPPRSAPYSRPPVPLAAISMRIADAARGLGMRPFRIPLAYDERSSGCVICDGYACGTGSKNDLALRVIPELVRRGMELHPGTVALRLQRRGRRIVSVEAYDRTSDRRVEYQADRVILAAGALASPHLLLNSGLAQVNTGGDVIGRYLMRHCNAFVYAFFARAPNPQRQHHKQVAIHDFYLGDPRSADAPRGKLGNIQQIMHPQLGGILRGPARRLEGMGRTGRVMERVLAGATGVVARRMTGLQVIAEDQPNYYNRLELDRSRTDRFGLPVLRVMHEYSERDLAARTALVRRAREILTAAGAAFIAHVHEVDTFSHAVGTVRAGLDPYSSALDEHCAFRGLDNLSVVDGSFMPTSGGVNPSLTIAANALRVGAHLARG